MDDTTQDGGAGGTQPAPGGSGASGKTAVGGALGGSEGGSAGTRNDDGSPSGETGGGGGGGTAGAGAEAGVGGSAGRSECEHAGVEIAVVLPDEKGYVCAGQESTLQLSARGGTPPYRWELVDSVDFALGNDEGSDVAVTGTPALAGQYTLRAIVRDGCNQEATHDLAVQVREEPELVQRKLAHACAGHLYRTVLDLDLDPNRRADTYSQETLPAGLTMNVATGVVEGSPRDAGELGFDLTLENACGSSTASFNLFVNDRDLCPIRPEPWRRSIPAPCRSSPYRLTFNTPDPATWRALAVPPGLDLPPIDNATSAELSGTSNGPGTLLIEIQVGDQYTVSGYSVTPRDACWFAYVSNDPEPKLNLIDPVLHPSHGEARRASRSGVSDFAFSPNGRFLAYIAAGESVRELVIVNVATWQEHTVSLPGDVTRCAWSEDGALAVALRDANQAYLGGLDVASISWQANTSTPFPAVLANVDAPLMWLGNDVVAYSSTVDSNSRLYFARRGAPNQGFAEPEAAGPEYLEPAIQGTRDGVFVTEWQSTPAKGPGVPAARLDFIFPAQNPNAHPLLVPHHPEEVVAPSGLHTGRGVANRFEVFGAAQETLGQAPVPAITVANCKKFLAWNQASDRIACVNDSSIPGEAGELHLFSLNTPESSTLVPGSGNYSVVASTDKRRGFSPSGRRFAYSTGAALFVADLRTSPYSVRELAGTADVVDFEFSPDDRFVLVNIGAHTRVKAYNLEDPIGSASSLKSATTSRCVEEFARKPNEWCGRITSTAGFVWAPFPTFVAYRDGPNHVLLKDLSRFDTGELQTPFDGEAQSFAFQPAAK